MITIYDKIRALVNDEPGFIFSDEKLKPIVLQAMSVVPPLSAALLAMRVGNFEYADRMFLLCGAEFRSLKDSTVSESRKTENSELEQSDAASGSQSATTPETHGSSEAG